ncbi:hypothetical protein [Crocosphaera chwakensis]|uniref:Uncharacterized protein n=1 Tax=Crocosphaera chwakensis CCY0110 TaxID=391612 RepID=A3IVX6_9CHRO|nr:hypothetical protein [Crocosphaera chwakensis]EAZ89362.1 hypothetical protein CY0110_30815 [Crocosphaera chwakensis CCY0110]
MTKNIQDNYHKILQSIEDSYDEMYREAYEWETANDEEPPECYPSIDYALQADLLAIEKTVYKDVLESGQIREKGQVVAEIIEQTNSITLTSNRLLIADIDLEDKAISSYLEFLQTYTFNSKTILTVYRSLNGLRIFDFENFYDDINSILKILQDIKADPNYINFVTKTKSCHARLTPKKDSFMDYWNLVKLNICDNDYINCPYKVSEIIGQIGYDEARQNLMDRYSIHVPKFYRVKDYYEHYTRSQEILCGVLA